MTDRETFQLVIRPEPLKPGDPPVEVRLKVFLKRLLRNLDFQCLDIRQLPPAVTNHAPEKGDDPEPEVY